LNIPEGKVVYIRFKSSNGEWGPVYTFKYKKPYPTRNGNIIRAEYYINFDPGEGNGIAIPVDALGQIQPVTINGLNYGDKIYIRIMDSFYRWSPSVVKVYKNYQENRNSTIVAGEYFINSDPGVGNGIPIKIDAFGKATIKHVDIQKGDVIFVRYKDSYGRWSPAYSVEYN